MDIQVHGLSWIVMDSMGDTRRPVALGNKHSARFAFVLEESLPIALLCTNRYQTWYASSLHTCIFPGTALSSVYVKTTHTKMRKQEVMTDFPPMARTIQTLWYQCTLRLTQSSVGAWEKGEAV